MDTEYADAQRSANAAFDNPNTIQGMHDVMYNSAKQARIDAIRDMGLPTDRRVTFLGTPGPSDEELKDTMKASRITQQGIRRGRRKSV